MNIHPKIKDHLVNLAIVSLLLIGAIVFFSAAKQTPQPSVPQPLREILEDPQFDLSNPLHRAFLKDSWQFFYPDSGSEAGSIIEHLENYQAGQLLAKAEAARKKKLSFSALGSLTVMFFKFISAYLLVLAISYYGVQTLGLLRFIRWRQDRPGSWQRIILLRKGLQRPKSLPALWQQTLPFLEVLGKSGAKLFGYAVLFSPAYVIAYALKTGIKTDTFPFLVLLGVLSNGLLILYSQKFYTFLRDEHRKGYVETAIVKNLAQSYQFDQQNGIPWRSVFAWKKSFPGHVLEHIFMSAQIQYISTLKEQAAFIITSIAIIEMALNIQGYLSYTLLQNLLYDQYDLVFAILLGLFWLVKFTEIAADQLYLHFAKRYENP